jgi:HK97 family phage portal protein
MLHFFTPAKKQPAAPQNIVRTVVSPSSQWDFYSLDPNLNIPVLSESTALQVSAIYACVNLISGAIAGLPLHVYRVSQDGQRDRTVNDPIWWVLNEQMSPRWNAATGWEYMAASLLLHGNAYARIWRGPNAMPTEIEPIHPSRITTALNYEKRRLIYQIAPEDLVPGQLVVLDQDDVLHVPGFGFDGYKGMSPIRHALRMPGAVAMSAQEFSANFFGNSARPDYVIQTEQKLGPDAIETMRDQINARHRGPDKAFRPMLLQQGMEVKTISLPITDMQLIETRQFQIEEIARIYGVPPFMIGHNEKTTSWGSGVEAMGIGFVRYCLRQHLTKFETEFNRKLFRTAAKRVEFDTFDLERADMKSMFDSFRIALGRAGEPGWMTTEEIRTRMNMKAQPDGQLNPGTTIDATAEPTAQPAAA